MTAEPKELPVYIITSSNWTMEVQMNEYNAQFDIESQIMEAATTAVEVFKGVKEEPPMIMNPDSKDEEPFMGTTLLVLPKGADPDDPAIIFTHVCFSNAGFYKESNELEKTLENQLFEIKKKQNIEQEKREQERQESLKMFEALKKQIAPKKKRQKKLKDLPPEDKGTL